MLGGVPLDDPGAADLVAGWRDVPGRLGLRFMFLNDPARQMLHDGAFDWLWPAAEKAGVPIAALATESLELLGDIAGSHPGLRLTIDHLGGRGGNTTLKDHAAMARMPELLASRSTPTSRSRRRGRPAIRQKRIRSRSCRTMCGGSSTDRSLMLEAASSAWAATRRAWRLAPKEPTYQPSATPAHGKDKRPFPQRVNRLSKG